MKLRQLQCFCAVVEAGFNISRAAAVLHATQPAVSKQLRQFEDELGLELLLRQAGRPVELTNAGESTLAWARRALQCTENIRGMARDTAGGDGGIITLATSHTHANYILLPAILLFRERYPRARITVMQGTPSQVAELVREGKVAVGVTHLPEDLPSELVAVTFLRAPRVVVTQANHPLLKVRKLTLQAISQYPLILSHSARLHGARIVRRFSSAGLEPNVVMQALDADVIKTYVAAGLGVGIIPGFAFSAKKDRGLRIRAAGDLFDESEVAVLLRSNSYLQKFVYEFLAALHPSLETRHLQTLVLGHEP